METKTADMAAAPQTKIGMFLISAISLADNYRTIFEKETIQELAASIKEKGIISALTLRPDPKKKDGYQVVCGGRRYRASVIAGLKEIPATVRNVSDEEMLELQIMENIDREDVSPMEEALAFKRLMEFKQYDAKQIATRMGKSENYVAIRVKLNELHENYQKVMHKGGMSLEDAMWLCRISQEDQLAIWKERRFTLTTNIQIGDYIKRNFSNDLSKAIFDIADAKLVPAAGACTVCPFNSACSGSLFPELAKGKAVCSKSTCFRNKGIVAWEKILKEAQADPTIEMFVTSDYTPDSKDEVLYKKQGIKLLGYRDYEKVTSKNPKAKKSFMVDGEQQGKCIYITIKKDAAKAENKSAKEHLAEGKITPALINTEIKGIQDRAERKKEIGDSAVQEQIFELMVKRPTYRASKSNLLRTDKIAIIIILLKESRGYSTKIGASKEVKKIMGIEETGCRNNKLYEKLSKMNDGQLGSLFNVVIRCFIMEKAEPGKEDNAKTSNIGAALRDIAKYEDSGGFKKIIAAQAEVNKITDERVTERVAKLRLQLKEAGPKASDKKIKPKKK